MDQRRSKFSESFGLDRYWSIECPSLTHLRGGRNGYGAKLTNVFSKKFIVETADKSVGKKFSQTFENNMTTKQKPKISEHSGNDYTKVTFWPDFAKFGMDGCDLRLVKGKSTPQKSAHPNKSTFVQKNSSQDGLKTALALTTSEGHAHSRPWIEKSHPWSNASLGRKALALVHFIFVATSQLKKAWEHTWKSQTSFHQPPATCLIKRLSG